MQRREFLRAGAGAALAAFASPLAALAADQPLRFGLITDLHYAQIPTRGRRYYADSLAKLRQAVECFAERRLPLAVELGDLIDKGPSKADDLDYLKAMRQCFETFKGQRRFVLGNHCLATLSREEFLEAWGTPGVKTHYSFDVGSWHFVVLDADYKRDGTPYRAGNFHWTDSWIPEAQQKWLADDLRRAAPRRAIVLIHQNLQDQSARCGVKNAEQVRRILESAGNVKAVFQGHLHEGFFGRINGIPYCTLKAAVEGRGLDNAFAIVTLGPGEEIALEGSGRQGSLSLHA